MKTAIRIRDVLLKRIGGIFEIAEKNRETRKQDKVERWPALSVYLEPMDSSPAAMRGHRERDQDIVVALFWQCEQDLEAKFADDHDTIEALVEQLRKAGEFGNQVSIYLSNSEFNFPPDSRNKFGAIIMTFSANFTESISAATG